MDNSKVYLTLKSKESNDKIRFLFESKGEEIIQKVVDYSLVATIQDKPIYNLGFGDYNSENDEMSDDVNSNNGDMRKVFNTVLSTVPLFFASSPNSGIWVEGSDSDDSFIDTCKPNCKKKMHG